MIVKFTDGCINNEDNFGNFISVKIRGVGGMIENLTKENQKIQ